MVPEGQLGPHGRDESHRRVVGTGEHEAKPRSGDALRHLLGSELYLGAKGFEHISRSRPARRRPVAVLGYRNSRPPGHEGRHRRDVDGPFRVAAGPASVHHVVGRFYSLGEAAHGAGETYDLRHRLAPEPQRREQRRRGRRRYCALHNGLERPLSLAFGEVFSGGCLP